MHELVIDTNILLDSQKPDGASDVSIIELKAARQVIAELLTSTLTLRYSSAMLTEYQRQGVLDLRVIRNLLDQERLKKIEPVRISGGQRVQLRKHVETPDQPFVLAAAKTDCKPKTLVTRDPKTTNKNSRGYVKGEYGVAVLLASEWVSRRRQN